MVVGLYYGVMIEVAGFIAYNTIGSTVSKIGTIIGFFS